MTRHNIRTIACLALMLLLAACGSKKNVVADSKPGTTTPASTAIKHTDAAAIVRQMAALAPEATNLVASIDFNIRTGKKDITVDGKISMRRDQVIRIQLSPLGLVEVGRIEFTPDSVLILDRMHKQYLKSSYQQVSFLKNNGIDFRALQAFFWNRLFAPGESDIAKAATQFQLDGNNISLQSGRINYRWTTDATYDHITAATATYNSQSHGQSSLQWAYADFRPFAGKQFPARHDMKISVPQAKGAAKELAVTVKMKNLKADSSWDTTTKVSSKYKPVELKDVINQIMKLQ